MYNYKRVTLLCGHYGSGKTNVAVNMALELAALGKNTAVADLDIVNPYFRTKDSKEDFEAAGVRLICSEYANTNLDIPALPQDIYAVTDDKSLNVIVDVGGDDRGAYALGRIAPALVSEGNFDCLMVINRFRPPTPDAKSTVEVMREIEAAGKIPFTGLVNNSNLGAETTAEDVLSSESYANEVSRLCGLPIRLTSFDKALENELSGRLSNPFPLKLQKRPV